MAHRVDAGEPNDLAFVFQQFQQRLDALAVGYLADDVDHPLAQLRRVVLLHETIQPGKPPAPERHQRLEGVFPDLRVVEQGNQFRNGDGVAQLPENGNGVLSYHGIGVVYPLEQQRELATAPDLAEDAQGRDAHAPVRVADCFLHRLERFLVGQLTKGIDRKAPDVGIDMLQVTPGHQVGRLPVGQFAKGFHDDVLQLARHAPGKVLNEEGAGLARPDVADGADHTVVEILAPAPQKRQELVHEHRLPQFGRGQNRSLAHRLLRIAQCAAQKRHGLEHPLFPDGTHELRPHHDIVVEAQQAQVLDAAPLSEAPKEHGGAAAQLRLGRVHELPKKIQHGPRAMARKGKGRLLRQCVAPLYQQQLQLRQERLVREGLQHLQHLELYRLVLLVEQARQVPGLAGKAKPAQRAQRDQPDGGAVMIKRRQQLPLGPPPDG